MRLSTHMLLLSVAVLGPLGIGASTGHAQSNSSALVGTRRFKFGPGGFVAHERDTGRNDTAVHLDVITGRIILGW